MVIVIAETALRSIIFVPNVLQIKLDFLTCSLYCNRNIDTKQEHVNLDLHWVALVRVWKCIPFAFTSGHNRERNVLSSHKINACSIQGQQSMCANSFINAGYSCRRPYMNELDWWNVTEVHFLVDRGMHISVQCSWIWNNIKYGSWR